MMELNEFIKNFDPEKFNWCPVCKGRLFVSAKHEDYKECPDCGCLYKYKNKIVINNIDEYYRIYDDVEKIERELKSDYPLYVRLTQDFLNDIFASGIQTFDYILAFGGGYPKAESFLNSNNIHVYDMIADVYEKHKERFFELYSHVKGKNVEFIKKVVDSSNIHEIIKSYLKNSPESKILITFFHIFEHLEPKFFFETIKSLVGKLSSEERKKVYFIIYQPNVETANNNQWFHFRAVEHVFFIPMKTYRIILQTFGFDLLSYRKYGIDLYIYGRLI